MKVTLLRYHRQCGRQNSGSTIAIGLWLLFIIIIVGLLFVGLSMLMGAQKETKDRVDSGMLNVGKKVLESASVPLLPTENELIFLDVASDDNESSPFIISPKNLTSLPSINLSRINRVWAKSMLIGINADAAEKDQIGGTGPKNAEQAYKGAKGVSDRLAKKLTDVDDLHKYFNDLTTRNSVRMLSASANVTAMAGKNWQTSLMQRGRESNITVAPPPYGLPPEYDSPGLLIKSTRTQVPESGKDLWFLPGFTPIELTGHTFWQVPFVYGEKTHMVSGNEFNAFTNGAKPIGEWEKPIPNAWSGEGVVSGSKSNDKTLKATSWVLANPGKTYKMSMPHSFVRIKIDKMETHWFFFPTVPPIPPEPVEYGDPQEYKIKDVPKSQTGPAMPLGGMFCAMVKAGDDVEVGFDVLGKTLDDIIFAAPGEGNLTSETYLLNRANEMISVPGRVITPADLHACLDDFMTIIYLYGDQNEYILFSPDGKKLEVMPKDLAMLKAPWLLLYQDNKPDGLEKQLVDSSCMAPLLNIVDAEPLPGFFLVPPVGWGKWTKNIFWTPGSGYNSCLGELRVKRGTAVYSFACALPDVLKIIFIF